MTLQVIARRRSRRAYRAAYEARLPALLAEPRAVRLWQPLRGDFTSFAR